MRSVEVCKRVGITYRQLVHLAGTHGFKPGNGSGTQREWTQDEVNRLTVAKALHGTAGVGTFSHFARLTLAGPTPPEVGWAYVHQGEVSYVTTERELTGRSGLIVAYVLDVALDDAAALI